MSEAKKELLKRLSGCLTALIEDGKTKEILCFEDEQEMRAHINQALKDGKAVTERGKTMWMTEQPILDLSKEASDRYTWDKKGNKVKVRKILVTKDNKTGIVTKKITGNGWRAP